MRIKNLVLAAIALTTAYAVSARTPAQATTASLNLYGMPGLIDMPTGESAPEGKLAGTLGYFGGMGRGTAFFQITPRLSGSFRYSFFLGCNCFGFSTYYDRSFDMQYQIMFEGRYRPALSVGLRDFIGTGIYSGEYFAATKHITPKLKVTGGIGWGRLGSYNGFANPFGLNKRPKFTGGTGGKPGYNQWFRGKAAFFAGAEWQTPLRGLTLKAEYSSDAYKFETGAPNLLVHRSPFNFGAEYQLGRFAKLGAYYLYGSEVALRATVAINPKNRPVGGSLEPAPTPVFRRPRDGEPGANLVADTAWTKQPGGKKILLKNLQVTLEDEGFIVESAAISATRAEVRVRNRLYDATPQAIGHVARAMSRIMPLSIETFVITPVVDGIPVVSVTILRRDLEDFENAPDGTAKMLEAVRFSAPKRRMDAEVIDGGVYPKLNWKIGPYQRTSLFDPGNPFRADLGVRISGKVELRPGLSISASLTKKIIGNLDSITRVSNSVLPHVRSDFGLYDIQGGNMALEYLTADYLFRPGKNLYGRVSVGYLESMFGGISTEVLWKPVNSRLGIGGELNIVRQRNYDHGFGFKSYSVVSAHVSAYYDMKRGFSAQIDAGRYLAGDWGATVTLARQFDNGWKIGAFATLTTVPFKKFGEGSFDKGFILSVPLSWAIGRPSSKVTYAVIRPITRDGGARLDVRNRLNDILHAYHSARMKPTWGRFWR